MKDTVVDEECLAMLHHAHLAQEFVLSRIAGLPRCKCGIHQYTARGVYIARDAIGIGLHDTYEGEPLTETGCMACQCLCLPGGAVRFVGAELSDLATAEGVA